MTDNSVAHWAVHIDSIIATAKRAPRAVAFLHLPKTGGSSISLNFSSSSGWSQIRLPPAVGDPNLCFCGGAECQQHLKGLAIARTDIPTGDSILLKFSHERYVTVRWILDELSRAGVKFELVSTVRPVRQRLISMFTDYWTQVFTADKYHSGELDLTTHRLNAVSSYLLDSAHYRHGRVIDGEAWFRAFSAHGSGVPFLLSEVFDKSTDLFRDALDSGALRVVSSSRLDDFLRELTGKTAFERTRVSVLLSSPLKDALRQATTLIEELVAREAHYDQILAEHLGDPSFSP